MVTLLCFALLILLLLGGGLLGYYIKNNYFLEVESQDERTNFLFLGLNGNGGADADLTDTMLFVSLKPEQPSVLVSLPRDIWVEEIKAKLNAAYHYGGMDLVARNINTVLGQKVHYYILVNFAGFEKIVDSLGGVLVEVEKSFTDYRYPVAGKEKDLCNGDPLLKCRYERVSFSAGKQLLDGQTALKYVRSRNAEGEEGTDFARSRRQQQLLKGLKETLIGSKIYLKPRKIKELKAIYQKYILTNITPSVYGSFLLLAKAVDWQNNKTVSLEDLLFNPRTHYSKQWVLLPKSGNWEEIKNYAAEILK